MFLHLVMDFVRSESCFAVDLHVMGLVSWTGFEFTVGSHAMVFSIAK